MQPCSPFTPACKRRAIEQYDSGSDLDESPPPPSRLIKRSLRVLPSLELPGECGKLVTVDKKRGRVELVVQLAKLFRIGRDTKNDYVVDRAGVSAFHAQLHALKSDTDEIFVCYEDTSRNGSMWNDRALHRAGVVLSSGDRVEIGGQTFSWQQAGSAKREMERNVEIVGEYIVLDRALGSGAFSVVHLAFNTNSMKQIACKRIRKRRLSSAEVENVQREVAILQTLQHPNINSVEKVYWKEDEICIFLELVPGGDLFSYLSKHHLIPAPETKFILYQLLQALDYMHRVMNISHRDLKLENIIVSGSGPFPKVLVADFGAARVADTSFSSITGTLVYLSPEALISVTRRGGYDGKQLDMWAIGVVFFMLLTGFHPFETSHTSQFDSYEAALLGSAMAHLETDDGPTRDAKTCANIVHGDLELPIGVTFGSDDAAGLVLSRALVGHLLEPNPKKRCTAPQGICSRWISGSRKELEELYVKVVLGRFA